MKRSGWEMIAVAIGMAFLVFLAWGKHVENEERNPSVYSSYDTGPNGYRALYEVLSQERVPVERAEREISFLQDSRVTKQPRAGTLIISSIAPERHAPALFRAQPLDQSDILELTTFVRNGGRLVVLDESGAKAVMKALAPTSRHARAAILVRVVPHGSKELRFAFGRGTVIVLTAPQIFSNAYLAKADNARFAYDVLSGNGVVAFYERIHGYVADKSFWDALPLPVHIAIFITLAIVVLGLIGATIRFAPPIPIGLPEERESSAYLAGMASLLRRSHAVRTPRGLDDIIDLSWLLAGTPPGDAALVRAAVAHARLRKDLE